MAKLTKAEAKKHAEAESLLVKDELAHEDKLFIFEHWQESANHVNSAAGAFFTPYDYAMDVALEIGKPNATVIDMCAGIGVLSYAITQRWTGADITCVEMNPAYVELGKKIIPDATWIQGDVFDLPSMREYQVAVSNPPFGRISGEFKTGRYTGKEFQYKVIDKAADLAKYGVFILPAMSAPFRYSGAPFFDWSPGREYQKFNQQTGIELDIGIGVDSTCYPPFKGAPVKTEVCVADFEESHLTTLI